MKEYYLLSLKWSKGDDYVWWGSNNSGYTADINKAGIYTEEQINKNPLYYCNKSTMPIPCKLLENAVKRTVVVADSFNFNLFCIDTHLKTAKEY